MNPTFRPTWRPFTTSISSLWIPTHRTTPRPFYERSEHAVNHDNYGHGGNQYQDYGPYPEWKLSNGNLGQPSESNYKFQNHSDKQWTKNHKTDQNLKQIYYSDRPEGSWSYEHRKEHRYDHRYYPPSYHYHHHHHHYYHNYGPTLNPSVNPSSNSATINDRRYDQGSILNADDSHWHSDHHYDSGHYDHYFEHTSNETDQRIQPYFPSGGYNKNNSEFYNESNKTKIFGIADDDLSANQKTDHNLPPNRQNYSRTNPRFYHPSFNHTFPFAGNILLNSDNKFTENWNQNKSQQDRLSPSWIGQENITWNQLNGSSFGFKPSTLHDQQNQEVQIKIQTHPWDQGK